MGNRCEQCHTRQGLDAGRAVKRARTLQPLPAAGSARHEPSARAATKARPCGVFVGMSTECITCHRTDFTSAQNPPHQTFPVDCSQCHNMNSWASANFNHNVVFPLTGAHATLPCTQCHTGNNFAARRATCNGCHMADYNGTTNPNHAQAAFPTDCSLCHSTINWSGATFNHSTTAFPLTGAHVTVACAQCHVNNNYTTVPTNCDACHLTEYNQTTNPNHAQAGFPLNCALCHSTTQLDRRRPSTIPRRPSR